MLTTPKDLSSQVGHILVLRLESVSRFERAGSLRVNEELSSRLSVGPAGRAFRGLDECVETTFQVPGHDEGKVCAHTSRVTDISFVKKADPRYLRGSTCERRGRSRRNNTDECHYRQSSERQDDALHRRNLPVGRAAVGCTTGSPRPLSTHLLRDVVLSLCPPVQTDTLPRLCVLVHPTNVLVRTGGFPRTAQNSHSRHLGE